VGAGRCRRAWITLLAAAAFALVADLGTKWLAFRYVAHQPVVVEREDVLQVAKNDPRMVTHLVPAHPPVVVVPRVLELTLVLNPGAVFGMGPGQRWFFIGFTAVALAFGLWMFASWTRANDRVAHVGVGLLIGGGLGNLYDRLTIGVVRDFLHPIPGLKWPFGWTFTGPTGEIWPYVSNVADALLLIGIGLLLAYLWRRDRAPA
jgi:signal peptidase II